VSDLQSGQVQSRSYRLNNLVTVQVSGDARYLTYFDNEYGRICRNSGHESAPSIVLRIVDRLSGADASELLYKGLFRFRYQVESLDDVTTVIWFERHWLDNFYTTAVGAFVQGQLLEPLIYLKLLEQDVLLMHAAGVARDGKAYIFPAHGGTGKTTLSLSLMQMGYDLLGDDLLMVEADSGLVHPYARPLHLFAYNLRSLTVPLGVRVAIAAKSLIRRLIHVTTGRKFLISTRVHADEIMSVRYADVSRLEKIIFLRQGGDHETFDCADPAHLQKAASLIIASSDLNESLSANIGLSQSAAEIEIAVVKRVLSNVSSMLAINGRAMKTDADRAVLASEHL